MRFRDMIASRSGLDRKAKRPKAYVDSTVRVGHKVRCEWEGHNPVIGTVAADLDDCWLIDVNKSDRYGHHWVKQERFNKVHCHRIRASQMSKVARGTDRKIELNEPIEDIYGDGDI